jgi:hypothetical protein
MKTYFKREDAESEFGVGVAYVEFTGEWPTRQVEIYQAGEIWFWGDLDHPENLGDQPFPEHKMKAEHRIEEPEFERVWAEAQRRYRARLYSRCGHDEAAL